MRAQPFSRYARQLESDVSSMSRDDGRSGHLVRAPRARRSPVHDAGDVRLVAAGVDVVGDLALGVVERGDAATRGAGGAGERRAGDDEEGKEGPEGAHGGEP
jgi:hypothetical protein